MLWARLKGDVQAMRASITPSEESRRMSKEWKDKSEAQIAEDGLGRLVNATGFEIIKQETSSRDSMHFTVLLNGVPHPEQKKPATSGKLTVRCITETDGPGGRATAPRASSRSAPA